MANELVTIEATVRQGRGKGYNRKLRRAGKLGANINDAGKSTPIELNPKFLSKAYKSAERTFNLNFEGKTRVVKIVELQIDAIKRVPYHVDLMYVK